MVSGKFSALVLALCFLLTAVLIPVSAHFPRWVEFELVLAVWWALWTGALPVLLYRGHAISDDFSQPTGGFIKNLDLGSLDLGGCSTGCAGFEWIGCADTLGAIAIGIMILIAAFVLIKFALPGVAFLIYFLIRGMLARVVNNRKDAGASVRAGHGLGNLLCDHLHLPARDIGLGDTRLSNASLAYDAPSVWQNVVRHNRKVQKRAPHWVGFVSNWLCEAMPECRQWPHRGGHQDGDCADAVY